MQDLNTIPSVGTFGEVARNANTNFSLLKIAVDLLEHSIEHSRGYFTSASALTTAFPSPAVGDWAIVEVNGTPTIYKCSTRGTWSNSGTAWAGGSVDLTEYAQKTELYNSGYYICETAAATAAKTVSASGYLLKTGGNIRIKMSYANTAANATLNIGGTGAKPLYYNNARASASNSWEAEEVVVVYYDGENFIASNAQGGGGKFATGEAVGGVGIDSTPTPGSDNLPSSGGVSASLAEKINIQDLSGTKNSWNLSFGGDYTWALGTIHDDGKAYSSSTYYHVNIPISGGTVVRLTANAEQTARYAFLKDTGFSYNSGGADITSHYSDGYALLNIIPVGESFTFVIPSDCHYLYVEMGQKTGVVRTPSANQYWKYRFDEEIAEIEQGMNARDDMNIMQFGRRGAYPATNWNDSMYSVFVPVSAGEKYAIKPNSSFALTISFLSSSSYTIGQAVTTVIEKHTIAAGVESVLPVPSGALYMLIAITRKSDSANYAPEYVKKILPIGDYSAENRILINEIEENATQWVECEYSSAISGTIGIDGKWASVTSSAAKSGEVAVTAGKLYLIKAQSTQPAVLRWLTASDTSHSNGDAAPVVESRGQIVLQAGSSITLKAPSGAAVLNYIKTFNSNNRQPVIEKQGSGSGGDDGDEVSEKIIVPKIGCGTAIVSRLEDTYAHAPIILESTKYRYVIYQGSENVTIEDGRGTTYSHVLSVLNKYTGKTQFIKVFDCNNPDVINGNTCSIYYNESAAFVREDILLIRTGCHLDGKWVEIYKTYNAVTNTLSSAALQQLSYGGSTYDFNLHNYLTMCNTLYSTSLNVVDVRYTNQITNITKYGNYYYCVYALLPDSDVELPYVFARSSDAITWVPIANVYTGHSAETQMAIVNDVAYFAFRSMNLGTFFMAFNISDGSVVKAAYKMSSMASKPSIVYSAKHGKVIVGYNKVVGNASNRIGLTVAEVSADYTLTTLKNYINSNGWNYFYFCEKPNGNILSVSVEDFRQLNGGVLNAQTTTDVRIEEIDMFELLNQ